MTTTPFNALRRFVALLALLALVAAACGDDSGDDGGDTDAESTTTTEAPDDGDDGDDSDDGSDDDSGDDGAGDDGGGDDGADDGTDEPEIVLTDSAPGVTATTIRIGVPVVDTVAIGWDPPFDAEKIWQVAADTINADGGVLGREIELAMELVSPVDFDAQDEICVRFTEDDPVFAVMGVIRNEVPLCYTQLHDTIAINTFQTLPEVFEQSVAPMIGFLPLAERSSAAQLRVLIESGLLDGRKVAINAAPDTVNVAEGMRDVLEAADIEVVSITNFESPSSDQLAIDNEMDINVEVWRDAGADVILPVPGVSVPVIGAVGRTGFDGLLVVTDAPGTDVGLLEGFGYDAAALNGAVAVVSPNEADLYEADQAGVRECVDTFDDAFDDDPPVELRPEDATTDQLGVMVRACQGLELFKLVAEAAGADLTNESFDAAADAMGEFTVTGVLAGSLGPGKRDYVDAAGALYEFDEALGRFVLS